MKITLLVTPKIPPVQWDDFIQKAPYSIALDGYVHGKPRFIQTEFGPYANFNHHEEVDRLGTRATCAQVLMAVRQGLFKTFNKPTTIYVNDCDQDVCLSWFILKNSWLAENTVNPRLNRLVHIGDMMDTCSGTYPFHEDMPILREISWIFEPYTKFRLSGQLHKKSGDEFYSVITDVENRIMKHVVGEGSEIDLDTRFSIVSNGKNGIYSIIKEEGKDSRIALPHNNINAFVSILDEAPGKFRYTIGKTSMFYPFDITKIIAKLNEAERDKTGDTLSADIWGGSNTIGGSPRVRGSVLNPDKIKSIIDSLI